MALRKQETFTTSSPGSTIADTIDLVKSDTGLVITIRVSDISGVEEVLDPKTSKSLIYFGEHSVTVNLSRLAVIALIEAIP